MSCPQRDAREEVQMWGGGGQRSSLWGRWVQWQLEGEENCHFCDGISYFSGGTLENSIKIVLMFGLNKGY